MQARGVDEIGARLAGIGADVSASLEVTLGNLASYLHRQARDDDELRGAIYPVPITAPALIGAASGIIDVPDLLGPKDGYWWDVRRLTVSGFSAGSVAVFLNGAPGENVANFAAAGPLIRPEIYLAGRDRLVFVATGITGNVIVGGQAIQVAERWWSRYLM